MCGVALHSVKEVDEEEEEVTITEEYTIPIATRQYYSPKEVYTTALLSLVSMICLVYSSPKGGALLFFSCQHVLCCTPSTEGGRRWYTAILLSPSPTFFVLLTVQPRKYTIVLLSSINRSCVTFSVPKAVVVTLLYLFLLFLC